MRFSVGDVVEFELGQGGSRNRPRWENNYDSGSTNKWATGKVIEVTPFSLKVEYGIPGYIGNGIYECPNLLHPDYNSSQWLKPGFLRRKIAPKCECGGDKARTTHSHWCPISNNKS